PVASDAAAAEAMQAEDHVFVGKVPAGVGAKASAFFRGVVCSGRGRGTSRGAEGRTGSVLNAREDAIGEAVNQAENFVMPKARIKGDLGDEIGRRIGGIVGGCVEAIACASFSEQEIARVEV